MIPRRWLWLLLVLLAALAVVLSHRAAPSMALRSKESVEHEEQGNLPTTKQASAEAVVSKGDAPRVVNDRFSDAMLIEQRGVVDWQQPGVYRRERLVRVASFKYPLLRVSDEIEVAKPGVARVKRQTAEVADHVIVRPLAGVSEAALLAALQQRGATIRRKLPTAGVWLVSFPQATLDTVPEVLASFARVGDKMIQHAEPDYVVHASVTPNDVSLDKLWAMNNTGQDGGLNDADIDAPEAWDLSTGSRSVVVAVVDTGIDYTHPDLASNIWRNTQEIPGNGIDDDGNGYVDDIRGWDFVNNDNEPLDDHSHGTHCAGTIGAVGNNTNGVTGVNWQVAMMPLKFLDATGTGATSDAAEAIAYASQMHVNVTSNSWSGGGFSETLRSVIEEAGTQGVLFVAAAGNESSDTDGLPSYPSGYEGANVIAVAATTRRDELAEYSNWGAISVDLAAPGTDVYSTVPGGGYAFKSGTSMATPHVAGACALLKAYRPGLSIEEIKTALLNSVDPLQSLAGKCVSGGRLNLYSALLYSTDIAIQTSGDLAYAMPLGGPVPEARVTCTLINHGDSNVQWTAASDSPWLKLSSTNGTLSAGSNASVNVTLDADATIELAAGRYQGVITFTNANTGRAQRRAVSLDVRPPVAFSFPLENDPGWVRTGEWMFGRPAGRGGDRFGKPDPSTGATDLNVFGVNLNGNYSLTPAGPFYLTAGPFNFKDYRSVRFAFRRWLNSDYDPWVTASVQISNDGVNWGSLWTNGGSFISEGAWSRQEYDISGIADGQSKIWVRWSYGVPHPESAWPCSGWNIDDVEFLGVEVRTLSFEPARLAITEGDAPTTVTLKVYPVLQTDATVSLSMTNGGQLQVQTVVVIPAGKGSVSVPVQVLNDEIPDGSQFVQLVARLPSYPSAKCDVTVHDNETGVLALSLEPSAKEGDGILASAGVVSLPSPAVVDLHVSLHSSDESEVTVPDEVIIRAGELTATFPLTVINDHEIDGPQTATITASVYNWQGASASIVIDDDESRSLSVIVPPQITEGSREPLTGIVQMAGTLSSRLLVTVVAADERQLKVSPTTLAIPAGSTQAPFSITAIDNAVLDGDRRVGINALAQGFETGRAEVLVRDDEILATPGNPTPTDGATRASPSSLLEWSSLPGTGVNPTSWDVYLGTTPQLTGRQKVGNTKSPRWQLGRLKRGITYYWSVAARRGSVSVRGPVWKFIVPSTGVPVRYQFIPLAKTYRANVPFRVAVTAFDEFGNVASEPVGPLALRALSVFNNEDLPVDIETSEITLNKGIWEALIPMDSTSFPTRFRVTDLNGVTAESSRFIVSPGLQLTVDVEANEVRENAGAKALKITVSIPSATRSPLTVSWRSMTPGPVPKGSLVIPAGKKSATGFVSVIDNNTIDGRRPVQLVVVASGYETAGAGFWVLDDDTNTITLEASGPVPEQHLGLERSAPLSLRFAKPATRDIFVRFTDDPPGRLMLPTRFFYVPAGETEVTFTLSAKSDAIVQGPQNVNLTAWYEDWASGSATLVIDDDDAKRLTVSAPLVGSEGMPPATGTITLGGTASRPWSVALSSSDVTRLGLPSSVTVPEGQSSVQFPITYVDDELANGSSRVTIRATTSEASASAAVTVRDDDASVFIFPGLPAIARVGKDTPVAISGFDVNGDKVGDGIGTLSLAAVSTTGVVRCTPESITLTDGVWKGNVRFLDATPHVRLVVSNTQGRWQSDEIEVRQGPVIDVSPTTLSAAVPQGLMATRIIHLENKGDEELTWQIQGSGGGVSSGAPHRLPSVLKRLNAHYSEITALVPDRYDFIDGVEGDHIVDGGGDMFDNGNYISFGSSTPFRYSDDVISDASAILGAGGAYFTRKVPGLFVFVADVNANADFHIVGNLGADGLGSTDRAVLTTTVGGVSYRGFVRRVYGTQDVSVNHLVIVPTQAGLGHTIASSTDDESHTVTGIKGPTRLYYLLFSTTNGSYVNNTQMLEIMNKFLNVIEASLGQFSDATPDSGTLAPSASADVSVTLDSLALSLGSYEETLRVTSNATTSEVPVTCKLTVAPALHHLSWSPLVASQQVNIPIPVTITAFDVNGTVAASFDGNAMLSTTSGAHISPSVAGPFVQGVWTGAITMKSVTAQTRVRATIGTVSADSDSIAATSSGTATLVLPLSLAEGQAPRQASLSISSALAVDTVFKITASPAQNSLVVPDAVTIPAGQRSVNFDVQPVDDDLLEPVQPVVVTASGAGFVDVSMNAGILDNDTTTLTMSLSATATEGVVVTGTLTMGKVSNSPTAISLSSGSSRVSMLASSVVIPSGSLSGTFQFVVPDDSLIQFDQIVTLTASSAITGSASASITAVDNESHQLILSSQVLSVREGAGMLFNAATISVGGKMSVPLNVQITSSDTSEIDHASFAIPLNGSSTSFSLRVNDDNLHDGTQTVMLTASAPGMLPVSWPLKVLDDDVDHFDIDSIASPQIMNKSFPVAVTARDVNGETIPYSGALTLSVQDDGNAVPFAFTNTTVLSLEMQTFQLTIPGKAANAVVSVFDSTFGLRAQSNPFAVDVGPAVRFAWSNLGSIQSVNVPFDSGLTAFDEGGNIATNFNASATFSKPLEVPVGTKSVTLDVPFHTSYHDARTQMIYTAAEIGGPWLIAGLAFEILSSASQTMNAFTVRMKQTTQGDYSASSKFHDTGWTTVYAGDLALQAPGVRPIHFSTPFVYDGKSNLMIDVSFNNSDFSTNSMAWAYATASARVITYYSDSRAGDPLTWSFNGFTVTQLPVIRLLVPGGALNVSPAKTGSFVNGVWNGSIAVGAEQKDLAIIATSGSVVGVSPVMQVQAQAALASSVARTSTTKINAADLLVEAQRVPKRFEVQRVPGVAVAPNGAQQLTLQFRRRVQRQGITYAVETSSDLKTWSSTGDDVETVSVVPDADGQTEIVTVRVLPAIANSSKFVRLRIDVQP